MQIIKITYSYELTCVCPKCSKIKYSDKRTIKTSMIFKSISNEGFQVTQTETSGLREKHMIESNGGNVLSLNNTVHWCRNV